MKALVPPYYSVLCKQKTIVPLPHHPSPFFHKCRPAAQQLALGGQKVEGDGKKGGMGGAPLPPLRPEKNKMKDSEQSCIAQSYILSN